MSETPWIFGANWIEGWNEEFLIFITSVAGKLQRVTCISWVSYPPRDKRKLIGILTIILKISFEQTRLSFLRLNLYNKRACSMFYVILLKFLGRLPEFLKNLFLSIFFVAMTSFGKNLAWKIFTSSRLIFNIFLLKDFGVEMQFRKSN